MRTVFAGFRPRSGAFVRLLRPTLLCLSLLIGASFVAAQSFEDASEVSGSVYESEPVYPAIIDVDLRDLPLADAWKPGDAIKEIPRKRTSFPKAETKPMPQIDPLLAIQEDAIPSEMNRAFNAPIVNRNGQGYSGVNPPDTAGDIGMDYFIQSINGSGGATYVIYNKSDGSVAAGPFNMDALGSGNCGSGLGDPVVLYDQAAQRWMISEFAGSGNFLCVYISQTSNPISGGWYNYSFATPNFPDYPKYGVWSDAYYVGTNENSARLYALDRTAMLAGQAATFQRFDASRLSGFGFQIVTPADLDGDTLPPAGSPGLFLRHKDDEVHGGATAGQDSLELYEFHVDWSNSANSNLNGPISIPISEFDSSLCGLSSFNCFAQPGTSTTLDPLREVVMFRLAYRNFGSHQTLVGNMVTDVNGNDRGGIRWFELRNSGSGWGLHQEGTFSPDATNRWMGAISMDGNGNIALAYNVASGSVYPGLRYAGRLAGDPLGTLPQGEYTIVNGSGANGSNRYGDYASMGVDPEDDCTFWFTGMYNSGSQWSTRIASFSFECVGCTPPNAPTGLGAAANGNNRIDLTWSASAGATSYNLYRATGSCPQSNYSQIASGISGTSYADTSVSGGVTYAYVVRAVSDCESSNSSCKAATANGACATAPSFDGIAAVTDLQQASCALGLAWSAATPNCGTGVSYSIYRATTSGFTPSATNRIASCVTATSFTDTDVSSGTTYYYIVRAEDNTSGGSGPCNGGNQDSNLIEGSGSPTGANSVLFSDNLESGTSNWTTAALSADAGTTAWALSTAQSNSPTHSYFTADEAKIKDQVVATANAVNLNAASELSFYHLYNTESTYDGGVLEYSTNGGSSWFDILAGNGAGIPANSSRFSANGYNATISASYNSPIGGRKAWSGNSSSWLKTTVNLSDFAGKAAAFRWRMACDSSVGGTGWYLDSISISGGGTCGNSCSYAISPSSASFGSAAANGSVTVSSASGCPWTAASNASWLSVTSGNSGSGNGSVGYSVAANSGSSSRSGSLTIAGKTFTVTQAAADQPPVVTITGPANGSSSSQGATVTFSGSAIDNEDGNISGSLSWTSSRDGVIGSGAGFSTTSLSVGTHSITASVTDSASHSASASISISVTGSNANPVADFSTSLNQLTASFTDLSTDSDGSISAWSWTFGDGASATSQNPSHTYAATGTFTVTLTVTDNGGAQGSISKQINVSSPGLPYIYPGQPVTGLSATTGNWLYYRIKVPTGGTNLVVSTAGGTGDVDLYLRYGTSPTSTAYDCRPYVSGNNESCSITLPNEGDYYIGLYAYTSYGGVTLSGSYVTPPVSDGFTETNLGASQGNWIYRTITVPANRISLDISTSGGTGDADLYVRLGAAPTTSSYDYRPYLSGNNETVFINNPTAGIWHIGIRAYATFAGVTLKAYHQPASAPVGSGQ